MLQLQRKRPFHTDAVFVQYFRENEACYENRTVTLLAIPVTGLSPKTSLSHF